MGSLGAFGLQFLPLQYIRYLGVVPIVLGIREIAAAFKFSDTKDIEKTTLKSTGKMLNAAFITMANGTDNIGVYIPLFAGFAVWQIALTVFIFIALIAFWCFLGKALAELPFLRNSLVRYKTVIVPVVYIALGVYIMVC